MTWFATAAAFLRRRILPIIVAILAIAIPWVWAVRERNRRRVAEEQARIAGSLPDIEGDTLRRQAAAVTKLQRELSAARQDRDEATAERAMMERELMRRRGEIDAAGDDVDALAALGNESFGHDTDTDRKAEE